MAVQAQYPSNILLLNRNVAAEPKTEDCLLQLRSKQPQPFPDDQSHNYNLLSDFQGNSRKRRREDDMNQFLHNQQQFQNQNVDVSTGLQLAFHEKHHHHSLSSMLSAQIEQQQHEIDHFLRTQEEEFQRMLASKRQMHYCALLRAAEESISQRIKDKNLEAEKAARRNAELEARMAHLSNEAHVWETKARAHQAEAAALQLQLQDAIVNGRRNVQEANEVGLRCAGGDVEDAESAYIDPERVVLVSGPGCKACGKRVASVVLLPCRHLCVCTECDGVVSACPLCLSFRSSSIEVYMS